MSCPPSFLNMHLGPRSKECTCIQDQMESAQHRKTQSKDQGPQNHQKRHALCRRCSRLGTHKIWPPATDEPILPCLLRLRPDHQFKEDQCAGSERGYTSCHHRHAWKTQCACVSSLLPAHICLWNYTRQQNKLDSGREIQKSKLHTQKISLEFHEHKVY